jgi:hypothetical protein
VHTCSLLAPLCHPCPSQTTPPDPTDTLTDDTTCSADGDPDTLVLSELKDKALTFTCKCSELGHTVTKTGSIEHHHPDCPAHRSAGSSSINLRGTIEGQQCDVLVDSGATISFISPETVLRMGFTPEQIIKVPTISVRLGDDSAVMVRTAVESKL